MCLIMGCTKHLWINTNSVFSWFLAKFSNTGLALNSRTFFLSLIIGSRTKKLQFFLVSSCSLEQVLSFGTKILYTVLLAAEILLICLGSFNFFELFPRGRRKCLLLYFIDFFSINQYFCTCIYIFKSWAFQKWPQNCASLYINEVMAVLKFPKSKNSAYLIYSFFSTGKWYLAQRETGPPRGQI